MFRLKTISHPVQNRDGVGGTQQHHHAWFALLCIVGSRVRIDAPFFVVWNQFGADCIRLAAR
jgi:hypothetical protein